ncbi:MAG: hypothetical protein AB1634_02585 [Thermodesulfobacteriota bacterium]
MRDWNVVITVREGGFARARRLLESLGEVGRTDFYNVLVMKAGDRPQYMETLREQVTAEPDLLSQVLARVLPASAVFNFQTPAQFESQAQEIVAALVPALANKAFHVRMTRRGFKGRLSSMDEERFLDHFLLAALEEAGTPGQIRFASPEAVIAIETVGPRAGLALWQRPDLERYPFLRIQ